MGVHTGDSVTVAPQMTLPDEAYQELRDAAVAVVRAVGVDTGGSNIQFARTRETGEVRVIEMNPRVSRSSALASKATGYPIAKVAAKLAVGYTLDEIPNDLTGTTPASFEPTLDYVVVKFPRFAFEKFPGADRTLGTQMKSVGETMGIGRTFAEAFLKAMRSRELDAGAATPWQTLADVPEDVHPFFVEEIWRIQEALLDIAGADVEQFVADDWLRLKRLGLSDSDIAAAADVPEARRARAAARLRRAPRVPARRLVRRRGRGGVELLLLDLGRGGRGAADGQRSRASSSSAPARTASARGSSSTTAACTRSRTFRELGYEAVMVNCNPETVSTDYDTSDRLYFEPLDAESVLAICDREQPGGRRHPVRRPDAAQARARDRGGRLPHPRHAVRRRRPRRGPRALRGPPARARHPLAGVGDGVVERRGGRGRERDRLSGARPAVVRARRPRDARLLHRRRGPRGARARPRARRPLPRERGRARRRRALRRRSTRTSPRSCSTSRRPASTPATPRACCRRRGSRPRRRRRSQQIVRTLGRALGVVGLLNVQLAITPDGEVYVLEANPRASRTVPFVSKATGVPARRRPPAVSPPARASPTSDCRRSGRRGSGA